MGVRTIDWRSISLCPMSMKIFVTVVKIESGAFTAKKTFAISGRNYPITFYALFLSTQKNLLSFTSEDGTKNSLMVIVFAQSVFAADLSPSCFH